MDDKVAQFGGLERPARLSALAVSNHPEAGRIGNAAVFKGAENAASTGADRRIDHRAGNAATRQHIRARRAATALASVQDIKTAGFGNAGIRQCLTLAKALGANRLIDARAHAAGSWRRRAVFVDSDGAGGKHGDQTEQQSSEEMTVTKRIHICH